MREKKGGGIGGVADGNVAVGVEDVVVVEDVICVDEIVESVCSGHGRMLTVGRSFN